MASITLKQINKVYPGNVEVIPSLDMEINDHEFVIMVGPSGCGKSTTLRMIAGLEDVTSGDMYIGEKRVNDLEPKDRDTAMVFQNYALYPHMSVYNNMAFALKLRKTPKQEIDTKVREAAKILDLEHLLDRKPKALSGGQRQRVALGRAIVRDPKVFLLDEPLSNLDAKLRTQMRAEITKLHKRLNTTFVYVTHDQTEAMTMADRIAVMKDGNLQQFDKPEQIYEKPNNLFVAGFIGSPQMNFLKVKLVKKMDALILEYNGFELKVPECRISDQLKIFIGKELILGIRPEDIHIEDEFMKLNKDSIIKVDLDLMELMGSEIYVYLNSGRDKFIMQAPTRVRKNIKSVIDVALDIKKMHLFDPGTEMAIQ